MKVLKTFLCQFLTSGETSGGPLGIGALAAAMQWQGTEHPASRYGEVIDQMGTAVLYPYSPAFSFFGTETGNFALYEGAGTLVLVEVISLAEEASLPCCLEFTFEPGTETAIVLEGLICFFDASLSVPSDLLVQPARYALGQPGVWDIIVLDCDYQVAYPVNSLLGSLQVMGICFRHCSMLK